jgi:hypothetical protein
VHHQARNNTEMSRIVEQGITRDLLHGSVMAWKFLAANRVPEDVILRVLADPARRRESDQTATASDARVLSITELAVMRLPGAD